MKLKFIVAFVASTFISSVAWGGHHACEYKNDQELTMLSNSYDAWKAVTNAMASCGNFTSTLDKDFQQKHSDALAANPSLYDIVGISNGSITPLLNAGTVRPLDALVKKYGSNLLPNQLIKIDGKIMAIAITVNNQHLMYREDIFQNLGISEPKNWNDVMDAAKKIKSAGVVDYPYAGTFKSGWNIAEEFVNMYLGNGGKFFGTGNAPSINNAQGVKSLETLKALTQYMDPEYLASDSTYAQKQMQQEKVAMGVLWATRAAAMENAEESKVVGKVKMASAPMGDVRPASSLWWDGIAIAKNISDAEAEAAFQVILEGIDKEMVSANNDKAVWLIDGYKAGPSAMGAMLTADNGAVPYPSGTRMGAMHGALGSNVADFLTGKKTATETLASIEEAYITKAKEQGLM
jgi:ABC-type glycerol-3-phosphate transport system substrate-binding protein